jgi:mycofactocin biosynthesis protein MftB
VESEESPGSAPTFDPERPWRLHRRVSLRDEDFGALAYHYENRRLVFLKSPRLVALVKSLDRFDSATEAVAVAVAEGERAQYTRALAQLAVAQVIDVR